VSSSTDRADDGSARSTAASVLEPFARLDALIDHALAAADPAVAARGLRSGDGGVPTGWQGVPGWSALASAHPGWGWLRDTYQLTDRELDAVLVALAPEVDLRYEQLYGQLQGDGRAVGVTVDLVLTLLFDSTEGKLAGRPIFRAAAPLIAGRVLRFIPASDAETQFLARRVRADPQIVDVLCRQSGLDDRLAAWCSLTPLQPGSADARPGAPARWADLCRLVADPRGRERLRVNLYGRPGSGRRAAAADLARHGALPLLTASLGSMASQRGDSWSDLLPIVLREAQLHAALLHLEGIEELRSREAGEGHDELEQLLARHCGPAVFSTSAPWRPSRRIPMAVLDIPVQVDDPSVRRDMWRQHLAAAGVSSREDDLAALASRFRLGPVPMENAVAGAVAMARLATPDAATVQVTARELLAAARHQTGHELAGLAPRMATGRSWADLVLPMEQMAQLRSMEQRLALASTVWHDWGFAARAAQNGQGVAALFTGPPGTGKTLAAQVLATELGLDLFTIDLSAVVSKYIGETEKNLERLFEAATDSSAVLFFDEADALFGKRTQVHDAHDRYANVETAYLLQRMETYDGIAVLATNLRQNLDDAFTRRLHFIVDFPFPDVEQRAQLWALNLPPAAPIEPGLDLRGLAERYPLTGSSIRNVALAAAFLAAADCVPIGSDHIHRAARSEYKKMGQVLDEAVHDRVRSER
jgi:hypothetical protein